MKATLSLSQTKATAYIKRSASLAAALTIVFGIVAFATPLAHAQNLTAAPRISLTFDDGLQSAITKAAPVLKAHGLTGTDYVITNCVGMTTTPNTCAADTNKPYMTWDQITQLQNTYGWEIGSHTASHPQLSTDKLTNAQLTTELSGSKSTLNAHGFAANAIAFPYGDYDNNVLAQTAKYYSSARGFADTDAPNSYPYNDALLLDQQVQTGAPAPTWSLCTDTTVAGVKSCIDKAIAGNQWLILTFHNITDTPEGNAESYDYSTSDLDQIAAYVQQMQAASKIKSVNISDGLVTGNNNLVAGGSFAGTTSLGTYVAKPSATAWTTDSASVTIDTATNGNFPEAKTSVKMVAGTTAEHLFSPMVSVSSSQSYILKNFVNISTYTSGEFGYYVHEYDAAGNELGGKQLKSFTAAAVETSSFSYTPSSASVATASIEVYATASSKLTAYVDNFRWYSTTETTTPPPTGGSGGGVVAGATTPALSLGPRAVTVVPNANNALSIFTATDAGLMGYKDQATAGEDLSSKAWGTIDESVIGLPEVVSTPSGAMAVFAHGTDGRLHHAWQATAGGSWAGNISPWNLALRGDPAVVFNFTGGMSVFVPDSNGNMREIDQIGAGSDMTTATVHNLGGNFQGKPVARNIDGKVVLFAHGADGRLYTKYQLVTGGAWSNWDVLGNQAIQGDPIVITNRLGGMTVVAIGANGELVGIDQTYKGESMNKPFYSLGKPGVNLTGTPALLQTSNGEQMIFAESTSGAVYHRGQVKANAYNWSGFFALGGSLVTKPTAVTNNNGGVSLYGRDTSGNVVVLSQPSYGASFATSWTSLGKN